MNQGRKSLLVFAIVLVVAILVLSGVVMLSVDSGYGFFFVFPVLSVFGGIFLAVVIIMAVNAVGDAKKKTGIQSGNEQTGKEVIKKELRAWQKLGLLMMVLLLCYWDFLFIRLGTIGWVIIVIEVFLILLVGRSLNRDYRL